MPNELRTPNKNLLIGSFDIVDGTPVLLVKSRGKQDVIDVSMIIDTIKNYITNVSPQNHY